MKAFVAKNKYFKGHSSEKDLLIIASTKKAALEAFEHQVSEWGWEYLKKDVVEVDILDMKLWSITFTPYNKEKSGMPLSECFDFDIFVRVSNGYDKRIISEDEKTTKELIKLFKDKHSNFLKEHF